MEKALGQYLIYRSIMRRRQPDREVLLAVPKNVAKVFDEPLGRLLMEDYDLRVLVFNPKQRKIIQWLP